MNQLNFGPKPLKTIQEKAQVERAHSKKRYYFDNHAISHHMEESRAESRLARLKVRHQHLKEEGVINESG